MLIDLDQTKYVLIIGDTKIVTDLIALNIGSIDGDDHLCLIGELQKHLKLTVRCKSRKYAGGMIIIQKLSAKLQI